MVGYVRDVLLPKFEIQSCFVANGREEFLVMARCECGLPTFTVQPSVKMEEKERKQPYRLYTSMVVYFVLTSSLFGSVFAGEFMFFYVNKIPPGNNLANDHMITACLISFMIKCQITSPFLLF